MALGYRFHKEWVIQDFDNVLLGPNHESIAVLCLENEALPSIGGEHNCQAANLSDDIYITRHPDLQSMPEFENVVMPTSDDLVALYVQSLQNSNDTTNIQITNNTDIDEFTKIIESTFTTADNAGTPFNPFDDYTYNVNSLIKFILSQDRNTGYVIFNNIAVPDLNNQTQHSPAVQEVFDSFELVQ